MKTKAEEALGQAIINVCKGAGQCDTCSFEGLCDVIFPDVRPEELTPKQVVGGLLMANSLKDELAGLKDTVIVLQNELWRGAR